MTATPALADAFVRLQDLTIDFEAGADVFRALQPTSLHVARGEVLGLVGESGSGKSITWLAALGLLGDRAHVGGSARLDGQELIGAGASVLETVRGGRIAMIFQDPASSLNPVHRIGRQITESLRLHRGLTGAAARREAIRLLGRVGIADPERRFTEYPHQFSGGMNQRVMVAIALAGAPDLLVADEPTTALDVTIQAQILDLLREIRRETGMSMVLISHDLGVVAENSDRIAIMYAGRIVEEAPTEAVFARARHPYTRALLAAMPELDGAPRRLKAIPGAVPSPAEMPAGCPFAPRCAERIARCDTVDPALTRCGDGHGVACHRVDPT